MLKICFWCLQRKQSTQWVDEDDEACSSENFNAIGDTAGDAQNIYKDATSKAVVTDSLAQVKLRMSELNVDNEKVLIEAEQFDPVSRKVRWRVTWIKRAINDLIKSVCPECLDSWCGDTVLKERKLQSVPEG